MAMLKITRGYIPLMMSLLCSPIFRRQATGFARCPVELSSLLASKIHMTGAFEICLASVKGSHFMWVKIVKQCHNQLFGNGNQTIPPSYSDV